jgi:hypothetical protein
MPSLPCFTWCVGPPAPINHVTGQCTLQLKHCCAVLNQWPMHRSKANPPDFTHIPTATPVASAYDRKTTVPRKPTILLPKTDIFHQKKAGCWLLKRDMVSVTFSLSDFCGAFSKGVLFRSPPPRLLFWAPTPKPTRSRRSLKQAQKMRVAKTNSWGGWRSRSCIGSCG